MIDWTISLGNVIEIVAFVGAGCSAYFAIRSDIRQLRSDHKNNHDDIVSINTNLKEITQAVASMGVVNNRLDRCEADVRELRHGEGFVNPTLRPT